MLYESNVIGALKAIDNTNKYVLADRNGVEPEAPYVLVSILNQKEIGSSDKNLTSKTKTQVISKTIQLVCRLTLHALATDVKQEEFESLRICIGESDFGISNFFQKGLSVLSVGDMIYSSAPIDTVMYKRAIFDIQLLTTRTEEFVAYTINEVDLTGTLQKEDGSGTEQINLEVKYDG